MPGQAIIRWGNSLAFRLPAALARQMNLSEGDRVQFTLKGRTLVVEPEAPPLPVFTAEDLAREVRKGKPRLVKFGKPRGKEAW